MSGKGFLCNMTENLQADCAQSRQAGFMQCFLCTLTAVHYNDIRQHKKAHHSLQPFYAKSDVPLSLLIFLCF